MPTPYVDQQPWAEVVFGVSVAAFAVGEFSQALKRRRGASRPDLRGEVLFRAIFFMAILALPLARARAPEASIGGVALFVLGTVIGWLGLLLRWSSFAALGTYFTTVVLASADQVVVVRGPYRLLRHPSYTGLLATFIGCGLMLGNWLGVVVSIPLILAGLIYRLLREEKLMTKTVGDAYRDFARDRARLIPFIW